MTALDFPDAPTPGDKFTAPGGIEWVFEDPLWVLAGTPGGGSGTPAVPDLWATFHPKGGPVGGTSSDKRPGFQALNAPNGGFHIEPVLSELVVEEDGTYEIVITVGGLNGAALTGNAYMTLALWVNGVERQTRIHHLGASWNGWAPHFVADLKAGDQLDIGLGGEFWSLFTIDSRFVPGGSFIRRIDPSPSSGGGGGSGGGGSDGFSFTQDTAPTATTAGQTWFDTSTGNSFVWFDGQWAQFAPGGGGGQAQVLVGDFQDVAEIGGIQQAFIEIAKVHYVNDPTRKYLAMLTATARKNGQDGASDTVLGLQRSDAVPIGVRTTWSPAPSAESMTAMWLLPPMAAAGPTWVSAQVKTNAGYTNVSERLLLVFDIGAR